MNKKYRVTLTPAERGVQVKALSTISLMLHRLGLPHKKTR